MPHNDPTDHALAAIASILDHKDTAAAKDHGRQSGTGVTETNAAAPHAEATHSDEAFHFVDAPQAMHSVQVTETVTVIAETTTVVTTAADDADTLIHQHDAPTTAPEALDDDTIDVDGYSRSGPGPLDAIRFRWTARRDDNGDYFVDETIGHSRPISTGPMPRRDVIAFIDGRERAARARFDELKSSMTLEHAHGRRHAQRDALDD